MAWQPRTEPVRRAAGLLVILALWLAACAGTQPRIPEVSSHQRTHTIMPQDEEFFVTDRASQISIEPAPLPAEQQRQEFLVRWTPRDLQRVKFEYRQVNRPNITGEQAQDVAGLRQAQFKIAGDDYTSGGPVSAWRVTLYDQDQQAVATRQSTLW